MTAERPTRPSVATCAARHRSSSYAALLFLAALVAGISANALRPPACDRRRAAGRTSVTVAAAPDRRPVSHRPHHRRDRRPLGKGLDEPLPDAPAHRREGHVRALRNGDAVRAAARPPDRSPTSNARTLSWLGSTRPIPGVAVTVRAVFASYGPRDSVPLTQTFHLVPVHGRWKWLLSRSRFQLYLARPLRQGTASTEALARLTGAGNGPSSSRYSTQPNAYRRMAALANILSGRGSSLSSSEPSDRCANVSSSSSARHSDAFRGAGN